MKKRMVVGNWKLYRRTEEESLKLARALKRRSKRSFCEVVVCPPFVHIASVGKALSGSRVMLGAQDVSAFVDEKHTGEVSGSMLRDLQVSYVIVGHSEQRAAYGDAQLREKLNAALTAGLSPIVCVGEKERLLPGDHFAYIEGQLRPLLEGLSKKDIGMLTVAYEPVWAIGKSSNDALKPMELQEVAIFIRKVLVETFGRAPGLAIPVLYGGSVEPENAASLVVDGGVDGLLVGHASTDLELFIEIVAAVSKTQK